MGGGPAFAGAVSRDGLNHSKLGLGFHAGQGPNCVKQGRFCDMAVQASESTASSRTNDSSSGQPDPTALPAP
jgi:hypothetical protein